MMTDFMVFIFIDKQIMWMGIVGGKFWYEYKYKNKEYRKPFVELLLLFVKLLNCCLRKNEGDEDCGRRL